MFSVCLSRTNLFLVYPTVWPRPSPRDGIIQAPGTYLAPELSEWEVPARDGRWIKSLPARSQVSSSNIPLLNNVMLFIKQYNNDFLNNYFQTTLSSSCSFR